MSSSRRLRLGRPECPLDVLVELCVEDHPEPDEPEDPDERDDRDEPEEPDDAEVLLSESKPESDRLGISSLGLTACLYACWICLSMSYPRL